jgi:apolipoprotein N-acyltransferase
MARMRSLEVGRYQLVVSNTGLTAIIDDHGSITTRVPPFQEYILSGNAKPLKGMTPWVKIKEWF